MVLVKIILALVAAVTGGLTIRSIVNITLGKDAPEWGRTLGWATVAIAACVLLVDVIKNADRIEMSFHQFCTSRTFRPVCYWHTTQSEYHQRTYYARPNYKLSQANALAHLGRSTMTITYPIFKKVGMEGEIVRIRFISVRTDIPFSDYVNELESQRCRSPDLWEYLAAIEQNSTLENGENGRITAVLLLETNQYFPMGYAKAQDGERVYYRPRTWGGKNMPMVVCE